MTSGKVPAKAFAVFAVALMFAVVFVPLVSNGSGDNVDAETIEPQYVYYHYNYTDAETSSEDSGTGGDNETDYVKVPYYGVVTAEYNPLYWSSDNGFDNWVEKSGSASLGSESNPLTLTIRYGVLDNTGTFSLPSYFKVVNYSIVSSYWEHKLLPQGNNTYKIDPLSAVAGSGTITFQFWIEDFEFDYVFCGWREGEADPNDPYRVDYLPGEILDEDVIGKGAHLYAVWAKPTIFYQNELSFSRNINVNVYSEIPYGTNVDSGYGKIESPAGDSAFTRIYLVSGTQETGDYIKMGTYRSASSEAVSTLEIKETWSGGPDYHIPMKGDVIIDNIKLKTGASTSNHGSDSDHGLYADGHRLTIGTNVTTVSGDPGNPMGYPQIFGGRASDTYEHTNDVGKTPPSSTDVIIFSGTYYNVVAGNYDVSMSGDTHLVIRGKTIVLDTVVGGNSAKKEGITVSNTWIYILGGCLPADSYQEDQLGTSGNTNGVTLTESTILTGGCNNGRVTGSTNVFISGDADLWDIQGAGRRGMSYVGTANVEVSGQAVIRHVLCGSITDGLDGTNDNGSPSDMNSYDGSVKNVNITVKDAAAVGSVFGAGYDTYYNPNYASMLNEGSISITMEGGTVGYLYGGGYRGAIGYSGDLRNGGAEKPINSISISITGGTVLGDVFGGGRGGVDKVLHNPDGTMGGSDKGSLAKGDSTGFAWTRAKSINIDISGGEVLGSVYGGGESVAILSKAGDITCSDSKTKVALVVADSIDVTVRGDAKVAGHLYGGGKGVDPSKIGSYDSADTVVLVKGTSENPDNEGEIIYYWKLDTIPWIGDGVVDGVQQYPKFVYESPEDDDGFAYVNVDKSIIVQVYGSANVGNGSESVFGGGDISRIDATDIEIILGDGTDSQPILSGNVFGGGRGVQGVDSVDSKRTIVLNNARVEGSVFGGSRNGNDVNGSGSSNIYLMFGTVTQNVFGGGFQGHSYMDSYIYFGTPAVELLEPQSYRPVGLIVGSIYGGGYYDTTGSGGYPELLHGDSTIQMGSGSISGSYVFNGYSNVGGSNQIAVTGDVFGQGSFSTISGSATVWVDGYRQETQDKDRMVMSFQGIDELRFIDSTVSINGSAQGGNTTLTEMMALNDIGHLILQGSSEIILHSEMNQVSEYSSYVTDGVPSNEADFIDGRCGNTIRLIDGAVALILGPSNLGPSLDDALDRTGLVEGFTLIEREVGEDYYGAFATASKYTGNDSGFLVLEGGEYVAASVLVEKNMKVWYIAGATTIERTLTFNKSNYSASVGLNIPRILGTTELRYTGAYIDYNIQDSMYVTYPREEGVHEPEEPYFTMLLRDNSKNVDPKWSVNVATHEFDDGWNVVSTDAGTVKDSSIVISSQFHGNMTISGLLGYVIIHIEEVSSYGSVDVPVHTIDMRIGIYIEPIFDPNTNPDSNTIRMTVVEGKATGYLSLPAMGNIYSYRVSEFSSTTLALNSFVLSADTTYFGRSGWESSPYMAGDGLTPNDGTSVIFGTGGAISPVIRIDYDGGAIGNEAKVMSFIVTADPVNGIGSEYVCQITVELVDSKPVHINLHYTGIGTDSGHSYTLSATTEGSATVLQWSDAGSGLELPFGTSIRDYAGSFIVRWTDENGESKIQVCSNLGEALQVLIDSINPAKVLIEGEYETFDYGEFFSGWYTDSRMINQFNLGSPVSQNINLYAKFGVTVIFDFGNNEPVNQMVLPAGTTLHDNKVFNFKEGEFDENGDFWMYTEDGKIKVEEASVIGKSYLDNSTSYAGHFLISNNGWVLDVDDPTQAYDFGSPLLESKTLYLVWEIESYTIEITVEEDADSTDFESGDFSATGAEVQYSDGKILFTAQYGSNISFTFLNGFHAVGVGNNDALSISNTGKTVGLVIRDAGENNAKVTIAMTVSDAMDITFQFKVEDGYTSNLDGNTLTVTASEKKLSFIEEGDHTMSSVRIGTQIQFDMIDEYDIYFWVNGILKTEYAVNSDDVNPEIIVMVMKKVNILPFENKGISGLNLYQVVVPSNLASGWAHSDTVINIGFAGSSVHENDYFSIVPDAGYYVPEGYVPYNTDRTVIGDGVYFTVNGSGNVYFDIIATTTGSFTLSVTVFGSDGVKSDDISSLKGWSILFTFDGHTTAILISESEDGSYLNPIVGTISYNAQSSVHSYSCSMNGFESVDGTLTQVGERLELELHPLPYKVNFHHLNGDVTGVQWDVLSVLSVPEKFVTATSGGCLLIVELINGDVPVRFLDTNVTGTVTVTYSDFDTSRVMDVSAIGPFQSELPPSDGTVIETIIILSSEAIAGNVIQVGLLFNKDVTLHVPVADGQVTVMFSASNQTLTIGGDIGGTGLFLASADGFQLWIYVMSDPEAVQ